MLLRNGAAARAALSICSRCGSLPRGFQVTSRRSTLIRFRSSRTATVPIPCPSETNSQLPLSAASVSSSRVASHSEIVLILNSADSRERRSSVRATRSARIMVSDDPQSALPKARSLALRRGTGRISSCRRPAILRSLPVAALTACWNSGRYWLQSYRWASTRRPTASAESRSTLQKRILTSRMGTWRLAIRPFYRQPAGVVVARERADGDLRADCWKESGSAAGQRLL